MQEDLREVVTKSVLFKGTRPVKRKKVVGDVVK